MKDLCIHLILSGNSVEVAVKSQMVCLEVFAAVSHLFWPLSLLTCWSSGSERGSGICSSALLDAASRPTHSSHSCCSWCSWSPSCCGLCCDRSQTPRLGTRVRAERLRESFNYMVHQHSPEVQLSTEEFMVDYSVVLSRWLWKGTGILYVNYSC